MFGLGRMALDVIGLAGFNYEFDALNIRGQRNELSVAFKTMFSADVDVPLFNIMRTFFPLLRMVVSPCYI